MVTEETRKIHWLESKGVEKFLEGLAPALLVIFVMLFAHMDRSSGDEKIEKLIVENTQLIMDNKTCVHVEPK